MNGLPEPVVTSGRGAPFCLITSVEEIAFESSSENYVLCFVIGGLQLHWGRVEVGASCSKKQLLPLLTHSHAH